MKKEIDFVITEKDFIENKISMKTATNLFESFKNYLKVLDEQELMDTGRDGKKLSISKLKKEINKEIQFCNDYIKGNLLVITNKNDLTFINTTEKIINTLIPKINYIILLRKKIKELEMKNE